jgi:cytochrome c peroxidase
MRNHRKEHGAADRLAHARRVLAHCETQIAEEAARQAIAAASVVTRTVISHATEAERMLSQITRAHALNGAGVFADPALREADLLSAREAIDQALAAMADVTQAVADRPRRGKMKRRAPIAPYCARSLRAAKPK